MSATLRPFPWHQLPALTLADLTAERTAKQAVESQLDLTRLPHVLNQLFMMELTGAGVQRSRITSERKQLGCQFLLRGKDLVIFLSLEPPLVAQVVRRVLGQPPRVDSNAALGPATTGAALAILAELARRISRDVPLVPDFSLSQDGRAAPIALGAQRALALDFWARLDGVSYAGFASVTHDRGVAQREPTALESAQGAVNVVLPLVLARCVLEADDYQSLCIGDVILPEDPTQLAWTKQHEGGRPIPDQTTAWVCSPGATRALTLSASNGKLCLAGSGNLSYDAPVTSKPAPRAAPKQGIPDVPTADVIMDAPVVIHIELGSVSLSAQSWLGLRVGDVVCSEVAVGRPVTLRVAERAVAEGELVTVDGQIGVRIQRFFKS